MGHIAERRVMHSRPDPDAGRGARRHGDADPGSIGPPLMGWEAGRAVWEDLVRIGTPRRFRTGEYLVRLGVHQPRLLAIRSGMCKIIDSDSDGHEVIVAVRGPGEVLGEISALTGGLPTASVVALQPIDAVAVRLADFEAYLEGSPTAGRTLAVVLAHRAAEWNRVALAAHRKVEARLADRILFLADHFGVEHDGVIEVQSPLTHDDYASWVGATRAVTTRSLGALRDRGFIDFGRGWVSVNDVDALRDLCRLEPGADARVGSRRASPG